MVSLVNSHSNYNQNTVAMNYDTIIESVKLMKYDKEYILCWLSVYHLVSSFQVGINK